MTEIQEQKALDIILFRRDVRRLLYEWGMSPTQIRDIVESVIQEKEERE